MLFASRCPPRRYYRSPLLVSHLQRFGVETKTLNTPNSLLNHIYIMRPSIQLAKYNNKKNKYWHYFPLSSLHLKTDRDCKEPQTVKLKSLLATAYKFRFW